MGENVKEDLRIMQAVESEAIVEKIKSRIELKNYQTLVNNGVEKLKKSGKHGDKDLDLYL